MSNFDIEMGKKLLRYKISYAENIQASDGDHYRYIYAINNFLALQVYRLQGIYPQIHFSQKCKQLILRIKISDIEKLSKEQQDFLNDTAPVIPHDEQYHKYMRQVLLGKVKSQTKEKTL